MKTLYLLGCIVFNLSKLTINLLKCAYISSVYWLYKPDRCDLSYDDYYADCIDTAAIEKAICELENPQLR